MPGHGEMTEEGDGNGADHCREDHRGALREVSVGEVVVDVDLAYAQDGTGPLTVRQIQRMGKGVLQNPARTIFFLDHASPSPRMELSNDHKFLREFAGRMGARLSDVGNGISHHVVLEEYASPRDLIVGADSHTVTGGALGAFATGMGSTDVALAMAFGKTWLRVPETFLVRVEGQLPRGVYSKDIILRLIGEITSRGATYKALEFVGSAIEGLSTDARATLGNMSVEAGAKVGIVPPATLPSASWRGWEGAPGTAPLPLIKKRPSRGPSSSMGRTWGPS